MADKSCIGIHIRKGSFSDRWVRYCEEKGIPYKIVNCLATDIIEQIKEVDAVLWHWPHYDYSSQLIARQIILAMEKAGKLVFPNFSTCWHFDDKLAQKYLLEAIGAPIAKTWIFFNEKDAMEWIETASWPKVFKLRRGAGSTNVRLVKNKKNAIKLVEKAFNSGFYVSPVMYDRLDWILKTKMKKHSLIHLLKKIPSVLINNIKKRGEMGKEKGYVLFQEFIPGATYDTRITVVGNRAWGFIRRVREGDFRASGSGLIVYDKNLIDINMVKTSFEISEKLNFQSMAYDYVKGVNGEWKLVEISYGYVPQAVYNCQGYWDKGLNWHEGHYWPQDAIVEDILGELHERKQ